MPVWHETIKHRIEAGDLAFIGVAQEQHPDRMRLFMQWRRQDWPVMVDPLNLTGANGVPIHVLIDEAGVVRHIRPSEEDFEAFMGAPAVAYKPAVEATPPDVGALAEAVRAGRAGAADHRRLGDALFVWGEGGGDRREAMDGAVNAYDAALEQAPDHGPTLFRLGVALLARAESAAAEPADFTRAIDALRAACEIDPNQYTWRRRLQKYGPRFDRPFPFYDWVNEARADIEARGETPVPLRAKPRGAEIGSPGDAPAPAGDEPDPDGRVNRDERALIRADVAVVPHAAGGDAVRVHVVLTPDPRLKAHWNNEGGGVELWVRPPEGVAVSPRVVRASNRRAAVSSETRILEFEAEPTAGGGPAPSTVPAYLLYYVCEGVDGVCMYLRQDLEIELWPGDGRDGAAR